MKWGIRRDYFKRFNFIKNEANIKILKSIIMDSRTLPNDKLQASYLLNTCFWNSFKTSVWNWCIITSKEHSILKPFRLSRIQFKEYASKGFLPGIKKRNF